MFQSGMAFATAIIFGVLSIKDDSFICLGLCTFSLLVTIYFYWLESGKEMDNDLRQLKMQIALKRVAMLNPKAGEIGAGMLRTIVFEAREALGMSNDA